jgi:hypothetical protein
MQIATDAYLEFQISGLPFAMLLSDTIVYCDNNRLTSFNSCITHQQVVIAHQPHACGQ